MQSSCVDLQFVVTNMFLYLHQDLRKQHDEQVSLYKEELEQTFKAKVRHRPPLLYHLLVLWFSHMVVLVSS